MAVERSQHWRDEPHPTQAGKRQRTIRNWLHYRQPGGDWQESAPGLAAMAGPPHDWSGAWDFSRGSSRAPLQFWARDALDAGNRALVGFRCSERPSSWLNVKALDIAQAVDAVWSHDGSSVSWPGLWAHSTLRYTVGAHKASKEIILDAPGHPASFSFTIKLPPLHSLTLTPDGGASICDGAGVEALKIRAPYGWDSATTAPTPDGHQRIRVALTEGAARGGYRTLVLTPHASDLAGAVYPVTIDPTVTISGAANIEDIGIGDVAPDGNFNNYGVSVFNLPIPRQGHGLFRVASASLPSGTTLTHTLNIYKQDASNQGTVNAFALLRDWVETQATWNSYKTGSAWTSPGCASGTDYEATPSQTVVGAAPRGYVAITLTPSWVDRWKAGTLANNGCILKASAVGESSTYTSYEEWEPEGAYWEITYTEAPSSRPYYYHFLTRRRRA